MTAIPAKSALTGGAVTEGGFKTALDQLIDALNERLVSGATPITNFLSTGIDDNGSAVRITVDAANNVIVGTGISTADGQLHVHKGSAGTVDAPANAVGVIENSTHAFLALLTPNTAQAGLYVGDPDDNDVAGLVYDHATNAWTWRGAGATVGTMAAGGDFDAAASLGFKGMKVQSFTFQLENNAGTLRHRIMQNFSVAAATFKDKISGATESFTNTPTGTDSSTAMAGGAKIGAASTHVVHFDVAAQVAADLCGVAAIAFNDTGTAVTVAVDSYSLNINGTTRVRLAFEFYNATTGAAFALNTSNIGASKSLQVQCLLFLK